LPQRSHSAFPARYAWHKHNELKEQYSDWIKQLQGFVVLCWFVYCFIAAVYGGMEMVHISPLRSIYHLLSALNALAANNKGMWPVKLSSSKILNWGCWLIQVILYNGRKMVVVAGVYEDYHALTCVIQLRMLMFCQLNIRRAFWEIHYCCYSVAVI